MMRPILALAVSMGLGSMLSAAIERPGVLLRGYIGAMVVAAIVRTLDDRFGFARLASAQVTQIGTVALAWFLCRVMVYPAIGGDYEAAVAAAGYAGFMLGVTANALAAMEELERKHGPAPRAFIVVPLVGAFLIDFTDALLLTMAANVLPRLSW